MMKIKFIRILDDYEKEINHAPLLQTDGKDLYIPEAAKSITTRQQV